MKRLLGLLVLGLLVCTLPKETRAWTVVNEKDLADLLIESGLVLEFRGGNRTVQGNHIINFYNNGKGLWTSPINVSTKFLWEVISEDKFTIQEKKILKRTPTEFTLNFNNMSAQALRPDNTYMYFAIVAPDNVITKEKIRKRKAEEEKRKAEEARKKSEEDRKNAEEARKKAEEARKKALYRTDGPKSINKAIDKFFKDRELDPIEGIWHSETEEAYYAIVKTGTITTGVNAGVVTYVQWTIKHKISKYNGTFDPNAEYRFDPLYNESGLILDFFCSTTMYYTDTLGSVEGKARGLCVLSEDRLTLTRRFDSGCYENAGCWKPITVKAKMHWPRNNKTIQRYKALRIAAIVAAFMVIFGIWLRWSRKNTLSDYNKTHKTNFKTYSDLKIFLEKKEYKKLKEEEEKEKKREIAEAKKIAIEQKKHEQQKLKEERSKAREAKVTTSEPSGGGLTSKIARLHKLYKNGTLTKAEFEKAKNNLLK